MMGFILSIFSVIFVVGFFVRPVSMAEMDYWKRQGKTMRLMLDSGL
tara:strand:+ start:509 stop:646 length:138 start_codon:yes stop_codon:yes gene_type:complete